MAKKKILIRIGSMRHGGAEKAVYNFLKNIPTDKYEIDLLLNLYSGKYLKDIPKWVNVQYIHLGEMITTNRPKDIIPKAKRVIWEFLLKKIPRLLYYNILHGKKYDVEIAAIHGMREEILTSPYPSKKIIWIQNDVSKQGISNKKFYQFFNYDKVMVIADDIKDYFISKSRNQQDLEKIIKIYNPIDEADIIKKSKLPFTKINWKKEGSTFLCVGTVFAQKAFDRLLMVHKQLINDGIHHNIHIIGDGTDFHKIYALKEKLGLSDTVLMSGFSDNPYPHLLNCDFFLLPSLFEGYPTILFEAIILKKKIIATNICGVDEILENGKLGYITDNSKEGIYDAIKKAVLFPESFNRFPQQIENYKKPFTIENSVNSIMKIIDEL